LLYFFIKKKIEVPTIIITIQFTAHSKQNRICRKENDLGCCSGYRMKTLAMTTPGRKSSIIPNEFPNQ
jgi:hypothetical protein